ELPNGGELRAGVGRLQGTLLRDGKLYLTVTVPIALGTQGGGRLTSAFLLDAAFAARLHQVVQVEAVFVVDGKPVVSTLPGLTEGQLAGAAGELSFRQPRQR